jgi:hypothetical protein
MERNKSPKRNRPSLPKLLTGLYFGYIFAVLRCVTALPLFTSLIRKQKAAADTARGPSDRLHPDGPALGLRYSDEGDFR